MFHRLPASTRPLVLSYVGLRRAVGVCGLLLPVLLGPVGYLAFGIPFQDNLSGYVHTPLRDVFVGLLFGIATLLFCYRGHDRLEDITANVAAAFALGLALFPLDPGSDPLHQRSALGVLHTLCGGGFFLTMTVYALLHFPVSTRTGRGGDTEPHQPQRNLIYRACGIAILLSMAAMGVYLLLLPPAWTRWCNSFHLLFWLEWVAVWAFAAAWLTKGRAIFTDLAVNLLALTQHKLVGPRP